VLRANNYEQLGTNLSEIKQAFAQAECRAGLAKHPYGSNINSAGNSDRILLTYLNMSKPSAGSQLKCDE
jgi:hypothetical protein